MVDSRPSRRTPGASRTDRFLRVYRTAPLEIRKKARILLWVNLPVIAAMIVSAVGINVLLDLHLRSALLELAMAVLLAGTLVVLRSGRYVLASSATIAVLLTGLTGGGLAGYSGEPRVDFALLGFNLLPVLLYACLIGSHRLLPVGTTVFSLVAFVAAFFLAVQAAGGQVGIVEVGTLINGLILLSMSGVMAYHVLRMNQELVRRTEAETARVQESLANAERLESLGVLAGGIAHDFNNLLNGMFGYIQLAQLKSGDPAAVEDHLEGAMGVFDRARGLSQQLLTFARSGEPKTHSIDVGPLLREVVRFGLAGSSVTSDFQLDDGLWPCDADRHQLAQVVENLAINARQAMDDRGRLSVHATNLDPDAAPPAPLKPGRYLELTFRDDGPGIPEDARAHVFDPFFTTKDTGSGLGLASAFSIVSRHGGHMTVDSEPGHGAVFRIYLPAAEEDPTASDELTFEGLADREHVLVVDDEPANLEIARDLLESLGYRVTCAESAVSALDAFTTARDGDLPFDAALIDLTLRGGRGGRHLLGQLHALDPDLRAVAVSGYATDTTLVNPIAAGFVGSLNKPFLRKDVARVMKASLAPKSD